MKVADYIADFIASMSPRVYGVCGAGAMHLNDAIANHPRIDVIAMHHEQAAAYAAEADARVTGKIGVIMVTAGPGGANAVTGVACAYVDSIPMLVIAGQVTSNTMVGHSGLRQLGMNELPMVKIMEPITKYAVTVTDAKTIRYTLEKAVKLATTGRQGPVFIEIPLDVQSAEIDPDKLERFNMVEAGNGAYISVQSVAVVNLLSESERPVVIVGNGVRLARACDEFLRAFTHLGIPIVSSWGAVDIVPTDHPNYIGRCGLFGDRASNFTVQNADLIMVIGTRLSTAQIGHAASLFAPNAIKVVIDIDKNEVCHKPTVYTDLGIIADAKEFLRQFYPRLRMQSSLAHSLWMERCAEMKKKYPVIGFDHSGATPKDRYGLNAYSVINNLSSQLQDDAIVLTDVGFCFIPAMQALRLRAGQRLIHSAGVSPMGWGIPAAIGAAFATKNTRQIVCLTGDGGAMMNLQELQTVSYHKLPITVFVFENDGYATMKIAQNNHFNREAMSGPKSGIGMPDYCKVAEAFGIKTMEFHYPPEFSLALPRVLGEGVDGPQLVVLHMDLEQVIAPRVQARMENGKFVPVSIEDMWPHLPREEFENNMSLRTERDFVAWARRKGEFCAVEQR